jgi:signal transduction histidine kinase
MNILDIAQNRVKKFGAQYYTFAIFGLINYPLALLYEYIIYQNSNGFLIRCLATLLCLGLLLKDKYPLKKYQKFLPLYWYFTITINVALLATLLLMKNNFSLGYLINFNIGVIILILLVDWLSFIIIQAVGISLALIIYYLQYSSIPALPNNQYIELFFYMFSCIVILGSIFTRSKEIHQSQVLRIKDELNQDLENKVKERTLDLEYALAAKTEFLNNMSHEIRTPVQGFTAISEGLAEHWTDFDETKRFSLVQTIASNARRLSSLLGGILDLAKFNKGKISLQITNFNLNILIQNIIDEAKVLYVHDKNIKFIFEPLEDTLFNGDYERIGQLLRNTLVNAIKFQDSGDIIIEYQKKPKYIHIKIIDAGVGIPAGELKSIFKSFTQSSRTKTKAGGTGLGLAIAREIVTAHDGKIWAENNKDQGATFHITLPLTKPHKMPEKLNKHKKIIMIDDETSCLLAMEIILSQVHQLITFDDQNLALEYIAENDDIDLILLDLMMPGLDGLDMLKIIKDRWKKLPVIIQSGTSDQTLIDAVYDIGIEGFITKPYDKDNILQIIDSL